MQENRPPTPPEEQRDTIEQLKIAGVIAAVAALVLFLLQNLQEAEINFLWFEWNTQMIWALIVSAALGGVGVFLAQTIVGRRRQRAKAKD